MWNERMMRMRMRMMMVTSVAALAMALGVRAQEDTQKFFFYWPTTTSQCQIIDLTWTNATPPFTAYIVPIFSRPFIYEIPDEAYSNGQGRYTIQLQLQQGAYYTMFMSDGRGFGSGGSSEVQVVGAGNVTSCLNTISANATSPSFSFTPAGRARQCLKGFDVSWNASPQEQPYNMSIIPLDQGFYPYEVELANDGWDGDWQVNMTTGTRFTLMLNSARGYGQGGVGGIYEVDNSTRTDCILQEPQPTGIWPVGLATNTLASSTNPPEEDGSSSSITGGAIAGIVIGVLAFFALLALLLWFLIRRKRRRQAAEDKARVTVGGGYDVDLGEGYDEQPQSGGDEGTIDPFRSEDSPGSVSQTLDGGTITSAGLARVHGFDPLVGSGGGGGHSPVSPITRVGEDQISRSQEAGPLPPKPRTSTDHRENLRITNPANPSSLPTIPPSFSPTSPSTHAGRNGTGVGVREMRMRTSGDQLRQPTFRRHEDAGRWRGQEQEEVVDLPPLYTDINRDEESEAGR